MEYGIFQFQTYIPIIFGGNFRNNNINYLFGYNIKRDIEDKKYGI